MANFIREFLEVFCFSSANLKPNKPLCVAVYCGPEPDVFFKIYAQLIELQGLTFSSFLETFSNFAPVFYLVYDRNMANLKNPFNSSKTISFQIQLCCFLCTLLTCRKKQDTYKMKKFNAKYIFT